MPTAEPFHVVLCSHDGERFIEEQVRSILDQLREADIVHIHDFASTDGTRVVLDRLRAVAGDRLSVTLHADAPGAAASFVRALRLTLPVLTDRSLVLLSDQDDVWLPGKLETIASELAKRGLSPGEPFILFHDVRVVDEDLNTTRPTYYTGDPFRVPRDLDRSRLLMANPAIGHTMLMSAPLVRELAAWPEIDRYMMHDWLAVLIADRIGRVEQVPAALSLYRQHGGNVLGAYRTRSGIASVSRLLRFADRMTWQAVAFSRAVHGARARSDGRRIGASRLDAPCRRGYRSAAAALSVAALVRGPTWRRKAIGALLLARAVLGPAERKRA